MVSGLSALTGFFYGQNSINKIVICCVFGVFLSSVNSEANWVWNATPDIPAYDNRWQRFESLWAAHWEGENIDAMLDLIAQLETDYPDKIDPVLWMGKLSALKGKYLKKEGAHYFKQAESYAQKAYQIDPENIIAFKILLDVLPYIGDKDYALSAHGDWIKRAAPLQTGYVVPPMTGNKDWEEAISLWNDRAGEKFDEITQKGLDAITKFNDLAEKNPRDILANSWACRVNYDTGQYYTSVGKHEKKGFAYYHDSLKYGNRAIALNQYFLPARYWSTLSQARLIQEKSILTKARYVNYMMANGLFGLREDSLYNYYGHALALATIITNGGWAAEKGISLAGVEIESLINQLWLAHLVYPTKLYALYGLADLYFYVGEENKSQEVLDMIFSSDMDQDQSLKLENRGVIRFSRKIQEKINLKK